jgi:hypothetical protein
MRIRLIIPAFLAFAIPSYAASIVASIAIPEGGISAWAQQTSSIDQVFGLTITSGSANSGDNGYLLFSTQMQIGFNNTYAPFERLSGYGVLQINDQSEIRGNDSKPTAACFSYQDACAVQFAFGVPFQVRVRATAEVDYVYRGATGAPQQIHNGASSSVRITPTVLVSAGSAALPVDAIIDSGGSDFFGQSTTYRNVKIAAPSIPASVSDVPEPASVGLVGLGFLIAAVVNKKARLRLKSGGPS